MHATLYDSLVAFAFFGLFGPHIPHVLALLHHTPLDHLVASGSVLILDCIVCGYLSFFASLSTPVSVSVTMLVSQPTGALMLVVLAVGLWLGLKLAVHVVVNFIISPGRRLCTCLPLLVSAVGRVSAPSSRAQLQDTTLCHSRVSSKSVDGDRHVRVQQRLEARIARLEARNTKLEERNMKLKEAAHLASIRDNKKIRAYQWEVRQHERHVIRQSQEMTRLEQQNDKLQEDLEAERESKRLAEEKLAKAASDLADAQAEVSEQKSEKLEFVLKLWPLEKQVAELDERVGELEENKDLVALNEAARCLMESEKESFRLERKALEDKLEQVTTTINRVTEESEDKIRFLGAKVESKDELLGSLFKDTKEFSDRIGVVSAQRDLALETLSAALEDRDRDAHVLDAARRRIAELEAVRQNASRDTVTSSKSCPQAPATATTRWPDATLPLVAPNLPPPS
ncbi:hypothetical protein C8Q76DRAFT_852744 [Earliella scabrosa]|nr:hypothetical protein C8Q76DRAFT_852744 [Earliella scabrosa]